MKTKGILRLVAILLLLCLALALFAGCSSYTCYLCGESTSKAYYDFDMTKNRVLCPDCARSYWAPLDISQFKVD